MNFEVIAQEASKHFQPRILPEDIRELVNEGSSPFLSDKEAEWIKNYIADNA